MLLEEDNCMKWLDKRKGTSVQIFGRIHHAMLMLITLVHVGTGSSCTSTSKYIQLLQKVAGLDLQFFGHIASDWCYFFIRTHHLPWDAVNTPHAIPRHEQVHGFIRWAQRYTGMHEVRSLNLGNRDGDLNQQTIYSDVVHVVKWKAQQRYRGLSQIRMSAPEF